MHQAWMCRLQRRFAYPQDLGIWLVVGNMLTTAFQRHQHPQEIQFQSMLQSQCKLSSWIFVFSSFIYSFSEQSSLPMCHTLGFPVTSTPIKKERHLEYQCVPRQQMDQWTGSHVSSGEGLCTLARPKEVDSYPGRLLRGNTKGKSSEIGLKSKE